MKIKNALDFNGAEVKYNLEKIQEQEIRVKSVDDFYDGPLSGECTWRGKDYYFECFDQIDPVTDADVSPRKYLLLSLSKEQLEENRGLIELLDKSPRSEYMKIYKEAPAQIITREQIVGWFESERLKQEWE